VRGITLALLLLLQARTSARRHHAWLLGTLWCVQIGDGERRSRQSELGGLWAPRKEAWTPCGVSLLVLVESLGMVGELCVDLDTWGSERGGGCGRTDLTDPASLIIAREVISEWGE